MKKTLTEKIGIFTALNLGLLVITYLLVAFILNSFDILGKTKVIDRVVILWFLGWSVGFVNSVVIKKLENKFENYKH